jgi:hypothetical protein
MVDADAMDDFADTMDGVGDGAGGVARSVIGVTMLVSLMELLMVVEMLRVGGNIMVAVTTGCLSSTFSINDLSFPAVKVLTWLVRCLFAARSLLVASRLVVGSMVGNHRLLLVW